MGGFFYKVVRIWEGVILTIRKFLKLKAAFCEYWTSIKIKISMICVSIEYEIKTKIQDYRSKSTGAMTTAKNDVFISLLGWIDFWREGIRIWWGGGEWANFWLVEPCVNFANRFLYIMKKLRTHHIHHVPKWLSYFRKIWTLCVSQIYMVYIFVCSVFVIQ